MPARNVYLSQDLDDRVKLLDLNVSKIVQEALEKEIERQTGCCARCGRPMEE